MASISEVPKMMREKLRLPHKLLPDVYWALMMVCVHLGPV